MLLPQKNPAQSLENHNVHQFIDRSRCIMWDHQTISLQHEINVIELKRCLEVFFAYKQSTEISHLK